MSKQRRILFAAVTAAVGVLLVSGYAPEKEAAANAGTERAAEVKPVICAIEEMVRNPACEEVAPEKTREDRIALRGAECIEPKGEPVQTVASPVLEEASVAEAENRPIQPVQEPPVAFVPPTEESPVSVPTPSAEISYSANGWQPTAAEHDHGTGADSGVCPACGLLYGPAGGAQGQYTAQDGLMD